MRQRGEGRALGIWRKGSPPHGEISEHLAWRKSQHLSWVLTDGDQSAMWREAGWSWAVATAWVRARNQGVSSCPASGQAGLPALTLGGWTLVALVMPVLPIFGASRRWPIHGYSPGLPTGPAGSLSTTPHLLLSPSWCSESGHQGSGVLGTHGWEDCHLARGAHRDAAVRQEPMLGQEGERGPGQKRVPVSTAG